MPNKPNKSGASSVAWLIGIGVVVVLLAIGAATGSGHKSTTTGGSGSSRTQSSWCAQHADDEAKVYPNGEWDAKTKRYFKECAGIDLDDD